MDIHEGITVKALLDSGTIEMFMDRKMVAKYGFRLQKLERPIVVRNVDGTNNSAGTIADHTIDLKETFKSKKGRIYPLSKNKKEEI